MALPSVRRAIERARRTAVRFPLAIASGLLVFVGVARSIEGPESEWLTRLCLTAGLGLSLFTAQVTTAERYRWSRLARGGTAGLLVLALVGLEVRSLGWSAGLTALRFGQLTLAAHLLVAVGPYLVGGNRNGFWQYNRFLFLRYLLAAFYAFVLWAGLAIALVAIDRLLGIRVRGEWYGHLAAFLAFAFHPWFFLAGVPEDYEALDELEDYPGGLKVFTQFVLLPLVVVYLAILTLYLGRILLRGSWPSGWIGYLVSSVSAAGVLAILLLHPIRERADSRWVNGYARWFFVAILPSLAMLMVAIGQRINQHGITERRYFLLVLALWMLGVAVWYAVTGSRDIRLIPATLVTVTLLTAFGPWGAYQVSYRSQVARLSRLLAESGRGRPGALRPSREPMSFAARKDLSGVLDYLEETRGQQAVARALGVAGSVIARTPTDTASDAHQASWRAMRYLGIAYVSRWQVDESQPNLDRSFWIQQVATARDSTEDIRGFEALKRFGISDTAWTVRLPDSVAVRAAWTLPRIRVALDGATEETLDLNPEFLALMKRSPAAERGVPGPIVIDRETDRLRIRLIWTQLSGRVARDTVWLQNGTGEMLVGRRRKS
jgi:hypothetical protein